MINEIFMFEYTYVVHNKQKSKYDYLSNRLK